MAERPEHGDEADQPDESTGTPSDSGGDPWSDAVDRPTAETEGTDGTEGTAGASGPTSDAGSPQDRPRMGFSGQGSGAGPQDRPSGSARSDDSDDGDFGELGAMFQQLMGGGRNQPGGMPDLGELVRQLGGSGGMPDLEALMRQLGGSGGVPDLEALMRQFGGTGGVPDLEALMRQLGGTGGMPDLDALMRQLGGAGGLAGAGESIERMWKQMGIDPRDSTTMSLLQNQIQQFFRAQTPEARMTMSTDVARKTVASESDPTVTAAQQREVDEAVRVAQLWIDPVTTLSPPTGSGLAWSRAEWVEATMPTWHRLVEPVADGVSAALTSALDDQLAQLTSEGGLEGLSGLEGLPQIPGLDLGNLLGQLQPALRQVAGSMFSAQLGHGVGALAGDLLSATEVGLPLLTTQDVALLPANVAAFTEGLGVDTGEVRLYLAVREAARARLFAQVPWLGPQLEAAVRDYARNITIDTDAIEEQVRSLDLQNPAGIQEALQNKLFSPTPTPAQRAALGRLEASLALVEGWVDRVTEQATAGKLPHADALGEAVRRRRVGGPAQKTFSGLVGLELTPRRLKDAANLWAALEDAGGMDFRDAPWEHPDIAPTGADLDDPLGYVEKRRAAGSDDAVDSALDALLRGGSDDADGTSGPQDEDPKR